MNSRAFACRFGRKWAFLGLAALSVTAFGVQVASAETVTSFGSDRYVSAVSGSDAGDCSNAATPCLTIGYAISKSQAGNTIHVAAGTYAAATAPVITLDGLQLIGDPANKPVLTRLGGSTNQQLLVIKGAKNVRIENFDFHVDQTFVAEAILANGFVDGLAIVNNTFEQSRSGAATSAFSFLNVISVNLDPLHNSAGLARTDGSSVTITGNVINGVTGSALARSGIALDGSVGTISNNTITSGTHDVVMRFASTVTGSSGTTVSISGNQLNGRGLEFDAPNASSGPVTISSNVFTAPAFASTCAAADCSLVMLRSNQQNIATTLSGNTFSGHANAYRGLLIENYPGVTLVGNTFTPANGAHDFVSLVVSNKQIDSGNPANAPYPMSITATGNTFNGSGVANAGRAVEMLDDNDANGTAMFGALLFGGAGTGQANTFDGNLRWYFHLDDYNCDTAPPSGSACTFLDYNGAIGNNGNTQVRPFGGNVNALQNTYAGQLPADMNVSQRNALTARTYDKIANPLLGIVDYNATANQSVVYVASSFASSSYGDAKSFSSAAPACGNQTVYFGINAFATIPDGIMHVQSGGTVCVAKGGYAASVMIAKPLQLIGDGNGASDTVISAPLGINAGGSTAATPLLIQNLRVANPTAGGHGILVSSFLAGAPIAHLHFDAVSSTSNAGYGLALDIGAPGSTNAPGIDDVAISNSHFDNNGSFGLMAGRYAVVSNVAISDSTFQGNEVGGVGFFETNNSGTGQISHWSVSASQFTSNAPDDASAGGGGLWIKTGGAGSAISDVSVTGTTFADNGSGGTYNGRFMNRVGIHVRARPGTTLAGINICNNTFSETATPGTQETGIYVFDQTANTGYQPITVCASNDFSMLPHSVSGYEQWKTSAGASQPVVNITGGTIANTEYINSSVTRVRDGATFPSITAAMNDAATTMGDEIHAPAGVYHENVTITHDGIKLSGDGASTIINGTGLTGNGIDASTRQNVTITSLAVQNFNIASSEGACIYTSGGSNGLSVTHTVLSECRNGRGGIYVNAIGDVTNVTLSNNDISNSDGRGIVVWNGAKSHLTINDNTIHDIAGSGGIGLQDGTASDLTITGNTITNTGDSGIFALGLSSGTISNNQVSIVGRYGIQLLNPSGTDATAITIQGNTVNLTALPASNDDIAGISVARRYVGAGGADNPTGVTISGNTVHGWQSNVARPGYDGLGIAVEGTAISVAGNTLESNDIGVQLQAGNAGYPGDSDQTLVNDFFSRGDAQNTCADLGTNTFTTNTIDSRSVTAVVGQSIKVIARNIARGTQFCTIQGAIDAASTVAGDTITVGAGTFGENVVVNKSILLKGPKATFAGYDSSRDGTGEAVINPSAGKPIYVTAANAMVDGFTFDGATRGQTVVTNTAAATNLQFINNRITNVFGAAGILTAPNTPNWTIARNLFKDFSNDTTPPTQYGQAIKYLASNGGLIEDNVFTHVQSNALQVEQNTGSIQILRNQVDGQSQYYTDTGLQLDGNAGATVLARDNTFTNTQNGLLIDNGSSTTTTVCNTVTNSKYGLLVLSFASLGSEDVGHVFDNALSGDVADVQNNWSANALMLGSNFYDGAAPSTGGNAALIADPLSATPIGNASCGDNTPTQVVAKSGSGQSTVINSAFGQSLDARVVDVLGGAVMGQLIAFTAPASGPSASLASISGTSNYNGVFATAASANALAGSYNVTAASGTLGLASFALTNTKGSGAVVFDNLNLTYTGSAQTLTAHMTPTDTNVTCVLTPATVTDAGSYPVSATCSGDNYAASGSATVTVAKAVGTITFGSGMPYTGAAQTVTAYITEEAGTSCTVTPATVGPAAGSYAVNVASCIGTNYSASGNGVVVIAKAASTVTINQADLQQSYGSTHAVGASASPITTGSVSVTYDGSASVPTATGSYSVVATLNDPNYTGSASAILVVGDASAVAVTISGPAQALLSAANAPYTDLVDYSGTIANSGPQTSQKVHYEIAVVRIDDGNATGGQPIAIAADDVRACIYDPSGYAAQDPNDHHGCPQDYDSLFLGQTSGAFNGRPATVFRYPNLAGNDTPLPTIDPAMTLPPSKFQFKHGDYQVHLSVVGTDGMVYATAMAETTVPDAAVSYNGATTGQAEDALLSQATLTNVGGRVDENVIVRVTLSDSANAALTPADATLYYQNGSGFVALPWTQANNNLVTYYGPGTGFPLEDGHNSTTSGQGIFHREGGYTITYEVVDIATMQVVYAQSQQAITVGPNLVNFSLTDLHQVYDGGQHPVSVDPSNVPHAVIYEALTGTTCPATPSGNDTTAPTNAGSYCVYVTATAPYSGTAQGMLVIAKAHAVVSIDGAASGIVSRSFDGSPQVVTATAMPAVAAIDMSYDGDATAPTPAGSYSLLARVNDPNYYGSATGTLVIAANGGATIVLDDNDGTVDGTIHRSFSGSAVAPVTATTTPSMSYRVTYVGDGDTMYPLTETPPTAVGQYHVVATTTDANYAQVSASGTLVVDAIDASIDLAGDPVGVVTLDTPLYSMLSATTHLSGPAASENVVANLVVSRGGNALIADLDIDYRAATQESASCVAASPGFWCPLALTQDGNALDATFGPATGFPLTDGAVSMFRTRYHRGGHYDVAVSIAGVSTDKTYANASQSIDVAQLKLQSAGPASASTGTNVDISATLANTGTAAISSTTAAPNDENVLGRFIVALAGDMLVPGDLTVSYLAPDNAYHAITLTACASDATMLCGDFGPSTGFPVAAGYNATSLFRAVLNRAGAYTITTRAVGVTSGATFATASSALTIAMSNATIAFDPASLTQTYNGGTHPVIVTTTPAGLSYTLTYDGGATPPTDAGDYAVVATITQAGYSGTASDVLHVVRATSSIDFGATNFTFDGQAHSTTAVLTQEPGNTTACTLTASSGDYPRTHAGSTTLNAACTGTNYAANGSTTLVVSPKAVTIALAGLGTFPYDGNAHAATATVSGDIAGFPAAVDVTYNPGGSSAPVQIGSYAVVATLDAASSQDYTTTPANGTITIGTGTAASIAANGAVTFSGTAGQLLPGPQPSVLVTDAGGHPAAGVTVTFAAGAGNGTLVAANQTTDANGIATLGGWILDPTPGTNALTATAAGVTGSVGFTAEGTAAASALQVTITDYRDYVQFGRSLTYVITVGNNGSSNMTGVAISDVLPVELDVTTNAWQCIAINGATCNTVTTRDLSGNIDLPAHSSVTYLLNARVNDTGSDLITNTVSATGPDGAVSATDTTEIVIFRDGFDGGDGAQSVAPMLDGVHASTLDGTQPVALDVRANALASLRVTTVAQAVDGAFRVEAIRIGNATWLRLVAGSGTGEAFSAWSALGDGAVMLAIDGDGMQLSLAGAVSDLRVALLKVGPFAFVHTQS